MPSDHQDGGQQHTSIEDFLAGTIGKSRDDTRAHGNQQGPRDAEPDTRTDV